MELTWLGAAGFEVKTRDKIFYLDPYLTRNADAEPVQPKTDAGIAPHSNIFISHAHFDHLMDIPHIARLSSSKIYCSDTARQYLIRNKVEENSIHTVQQDRQAFAFDGYDAQALFSHHIKFDKKLVLKTLVKINVKLFACLPYLCQFPCGRVLGWRFVLEDKTLLFYGSAGSTTAELDQAAETPVDILLMPLQGHSNICRIGLNHVNTLNPGVVIPHHHDNFFPPISGQVDIKPFVNGIKSAESRTRVIVPKMNTTIHL